eukprot:s3404_g1.t1
MVAKVLLHSGVKDDAATDMAMLEEEFESAGATYEIARHGSGVYHSFTEWMASVPMAAMYDQRADVRSWESTKHLLMELFAARLLLDSFSVRQICEALASATSDDVEPLVLALEGLTDFDEVRPLFLEADVNAFLQQGATAADPRLRSMVAKLVCRLATHGEATLDKLLEANMLNPCEPLLLDEDTGVAEAAARAVCAAAKFSAGRQAVIGSGSASGSSLLESFQCNAQVQRIRVLALFVELGRVADEAFAALESRKALDQVLHSFLTDDLLLKLNAVELMDAPGTTASGACSSTHAASLCLQLQKGPSVLQVAFGPMNSPISSSASISELHIPPQSDTALEVQLDLERKSSISRLKEFYLRRLSQSETAAVSRLRAKSTTFSSPRRILPRETEWEVASSKGFSKASETCSSVQTSPSSNPQECTKAVPRKSMADLDAKLVTVMAALERSAFRQRGGKTETGGA